MPATGSTGKTVLGIILFLTAAVILTGIDKPLEATLLQITPAWMTEIGTRFWSSSGLKSL